MSKKSIWQKVPYETAERVSTFSFFGKIRKKKDTWQITTCNKVTGKYEYGFSYSKKGAKDIVDFRHSQIENELLAFYEVEH